MYQGFKDFFTVVDRIEFNHDHQAYDNEIVFVESVIHVKFKGKDQEMALLMVTFFKIKNEKIVLLREYYDYKTLAGYLN